MQKGESMNTNFKKLLLERGETAASVGRAVGMPVSTTKQYSTGERSVGRKWSAAIAAHFGVSPEYIMDLTDDPGIKETKKEPAAPKDDELTQEINRLFAELTPENKLKAAAEILKLRRMQ